MLTIAKFLHDHAIDMADLAVQFDAGGTGLKARLALLPNGGQDALNEISGLNGMTVTELEDMAYIVTALVGPIVVTNRVQLAAVRRYV